jgi:hypothetical protein
MITLCQRVPRNSLLLVATAIVLIAQAPPKPVLENTGAPMRIGAQCKTEDLTALGLSCSHDEPCPVFLELSDVELVGSRLFVSGNLHTATVTLESLLLSSDDLGKTWIEPFTRIQSGALDTIQFVDFEGGWISGQIVQSLPKDPFFLLTTDGGKTWHKSALSGESRVGSIEHYHFETRTSGTLELDKIQPGENGMRYELYESMTGGESWMLRQVNQKPIPWKYSKAAPKGWRVRADAPTKTYRVEHQQGERWQTSASFLVSAGECKAPEPIAPEADPTRDAEPKAMPEEDPGVFRVKQQPSNSKKASPPKKKPR